MHRLPSAIGFGHGSRRTTAPIVAATIYLAITGAPAAFAQPFPSAGSPNPAMTGGGERTSPRARGTITVLPAQNAPVAAPAAPAPVPAARPIPSVAANASPAGSTVPRAVTVARATAIPRCTMFVDAVAPVRGAGTAQSPHKTIGAAVAAAPAGAVICVAEGTYPEQIKPGEKHFTLAGGFQSGTNFSVRDSARYVTKAQGRGGTFLRIEDPGPKGDQLTAIDGFEITGYAQAVVREVYYSQRLDLTNNTFHANHCPDRGEERIAGAGFSLNNVSGRIEGNVFRNNSCGRGGAGFLYDDAKENTVVVARNLVDANAGTQGTDSHGGALYLFGKVLTITGNLITNNTVTGWGAGLYVGAWPAGGNLTNATLSWNVYRGNRAGIAGGGMFCDDGANCTSAHEVYDRNCGGNIYLDGGSEDKDQTVSRFDHLTVVGALAVDCRGPGPGVRIDGNPKAPDSHSFVNALFWNNGPDITAGCDGGCSRVRVTVAHSMVDSKYVDNGLKVTFGDGILTPADPLFAAAEAGDFHLRSAAGRWTASGHVQDPVNSPALAKGVPNRSANDNPEHAGRRSELGAYGDSPEASHVR